MFRAVYNFFLFLGLIACLPKFIWDAVRHKKYRKSFIEKLGLRLPIFSDGPKIWIHAVSVGETKAVVPLVKKIQEENRGVKIVFSTTTETGLAEAKRSMDVETFYLPLDFSWNIRRLKKAIQPQLLILVESDFWYNLISMNDNVVVVNGKISEGSVARFRLLKFFTRRLFENIRLFCVQSERFAERFKSLGIPSSKIVVTGNLKLDQSSPLIDIPRWEKELGITPQDRVVTLGSTHESEEEGLLSLLQLPNVKILLVPRHPERFSAVAAILEKKGIPFSRYTDAGPKTGKAVLIDTMGILNTCYQLSELAIVGGSFVSHVGGHNIFEPAALGVPVLFGPHMQTQKDLVDIVVQGGAGRQVALDEISSVVQEMLSQPPEEMSKAGLKLAQEVQGSTSRTWDALLKNI